MKGGTAGDEYDGLVPFETIVKKGVLIKEIDERKQGLVDKCRSKHGLTLQEIIAHNDWLLQIERDLSKARARIEREFRISNALSLKVREGKRKAQLQQRLDTLRSQCDVLNDCINSLTVHRSWFQESGSHKEAVDYLEGRGRGVHEDTALSDVRFDMNSAVVQRAIAATKAAAKAPSSDGASAGAGASLAGEPGAAIDLGGEGAGCDIGDEQTAGDGRRHHELDGLIHTLASASDKKRRKKRRGKKGASQGLEESKDGGSDEEDDGEGEQEESLSGLDAFAADFQLLRALGHSEVDGSASYVDVWAPD